MCGNQVSTVSNPSGDFYNLVITQIPTKKIVIKDFSINVGHAAQLNALNIESIKELNLQKCRINHQTMQQLSAVTLPMLLKLNLNDNELGPIGCRLLAKSNLVSNLIELQLNNNKIKDAGLKALSQADLQVLEDLSLNDNQLSSQGLRTLERKLESVECLSLGGNKLTDSVVASLPKINPGIYYLKLSRNQITDEGLKNLINGFKKLDVLLIERNKIKSKKQNYKKPELFLFY